MSDPAFKGWLVAPKAGKNEASCKFSQKMFLARKHLYNGTVNPLSTKKHVQAQEIKLICLSVFENKKRGVSTKRQPPHK